MVLTRVAHQPSNPVKSVVRGGSAKTLSVANRPGNRPWSNLSRYGEILPASLMTTPIVMVRTSGLSAGSRALLASCGSA